MKNKVIWLFVICMVFMLSWIAGSRLQNPEEAAFHPVTSLSCESVPTHCKVRLSDATLELEFASPAIVMSPFVVKMTTTADVAEATMQFRMKNMDMGIQRYSLVNIGNGLWQSEVILPVCSLGRSDWNAALEVKYQNMWWRGDFDFEAASH